MGKEFNIKSTKKIKAKIVKAFYIPQTDLVRWDTQIEDGRLYSLTWPADEYGPSMNVTTGRIPTEMLIEHLNSLTDLQKEFYLEWNAVDLEN